MGPKKEEDPKKEPSISEFPSLGNSVTMNSAVSANNDFLRSYSQTKSGMDLRKELDSLTIGHGADDADSRNIDSEASAKHDFKNPMMKSNPPVQVDSLTAPSLGSTCNDFLKISMGIDSWSGTPRETEAQIEDQSVMTPFR